MIMNQKGKGNDCFGTPLHIFDQLNKIFNFTIDVACINENCKCLQGFCIDHGKDGLSESWAYHRAFCNPPFSDKAKWIMKAHQEVDYGLCPLCVMILPLNCMDTEIWHDCIEDKYHYEKLRGRISFIDPKTGKPKSGNNSGTVIVYFKKKIQTKAG